MGVEIRGDLPLTTQQYLLAPIPGVELIQLARHVDDSGSFTELGRFVNGYLRHPLDAVGFSLAQINYSELEPGAIKALHLHLRQTDFWFVPSTDKLLVVLYDCRASDEPWDDQARTRRLVLGDGRSNLLRIPPGVAHGGKNLRPALGRLIYFVDCEFDPLPSGCDEHRLPWDYLGADIWEVRRE